MAPFDIKEVRQLMEGDDLELDKFGQSAYWVEYDPTSHPYGEVLNILSPYKSPGEFPLILV